MYSNSHVLINIRKKSSTNPKLRIQIADIIKELRPEIERITSLPIGEQHAAFNELRKPFTEARRNAYQNGARSEGSPTWAVPAVCEHWIFGYQTGSQEELKKVEDVIQQLEDPNRPEETSFRTYFGMMIAFIGAPVAWYLTSWWLAIIVFVLGLILTGWQDRHQGPFPAR